MNCWAWDGLGSKVRRQQGQRGRRRVRATARWRRRVAIERRAMPLRAHGRSRGAGSRPAARAPRAGVASPRGKRAPLGDEEAVGGDAQGGVVVEAAPAPALIVIEPDLLLQFLVIALDPPSQLGGGHQLRERGVGGQGRQPVFGRLGFAVGPLDQEPLLGARLARRHRGGPAGPARRQSARPAAWPCPRATSRSATRRRQARARSWTATGW